MPSQQKIEVLTTGVITHPETLAQEGPDQRRQALAGVLGVKGFSYTLQKEEASFKDLRDVANYLLTLWQETLCLLFCVYYNVVPGGFGVNDNAASPCILTIFAKELKSRDLPARSTFFDREEDGNTGSRLYAAQTGKSTVTGTTNLDVCGFDDTTATCDKGREVKLVLRSLCDKALLDKHNGQALKYLPKSDKVSFTGS